MEKNNVEMDKIVNKIDLDVKKRGRKPKKEIINYEVNLTESNDLSDNDCNEDGSMKTKRRGRKPKDKFKYENTDVNEQDKTINDNIIIKLPLSCLKLNEQYNIGKDLYPYTYNPEITEPKPFNPNIDSTVHNIKYSLLNDNVDEQVNNLNGNTSDVNNVLCDCKTKNTKRQIDIILNNKYNCNIDRYNVLTHLGTHQTGIKWVDKTDIPCLWCCHTFKNIPIGLPYKYTNNKFQLFGNYCSPNCCLAYILQYYKGDDSLWEKVALLNFLCFKVTGEYKNIIPACDKMALKLFGGTLDIDQYRNLFFDNEKTYTLEFPPCNTIIPMLEEIYKKTNLNNSFIPLDKQKININSNELKLKRSKPIINHKNTIDFCINTS